MYVGLQALAAQREIIRTDLSRTARTAAALIDGDLHQQLTSSGSTGDAVYTELLQPLLRFHRNVPEIAYLYTLVERDGKLHFGLDTAQAAEQLGFEREMSASELLEPYESHSPEEDRAEISALRSGTDYVSPKPFSDDFGTFFTALSPIRNSQGYPVAAVGVDLRLNEYQHRFEAVRNSVALGLSILLVASLLVSVVVYRTRAETRREEEHKIAAQLETERILERGRRLVSAMGQIIYHYDVAKDAITWRGDCEKILGITADEMPARRAEMDLILFPQDARSFSWSVSRTRREFR